MRNRFKIYCLFIVISVTVICCRKDSPPVLLEQKGSINTGKRLLICDEGGFGYNNAGVSIYDPSSSATIINAYANSNSNQNLGDVLQSVTKFNDRYYL